MSRPPSRLIFATVRRNTFNPPFRLPLENVSALQSTLLRRQSDMLGREILRPCIFKVLLDPGLDVGSIRIKLTCSPGICRSCNSSLGGIMNILGHGGSAYAQFRRDFPLGKPAAMKKLYVQNGLLFFIWCTPLPPGKNIQYTQIFRRQEGRWHLSMSAPSLPPGGSFYHDHLQARRVESSFTHSSSVSGRWNENTLRLRASGSIVFVKRVSMPVLS